MRVILAFLAFLLAGTAAPGQVAYWSAPPQPVVWVWTAPAPAHHPAGWPQPWPAAAYQPVQAVPWQGWPPVAPPTLPALSWPVLAQPARWAPACPT